MKIFHKTPSNCSSVGVGSLAAYNSSSSVVCAYKIYMFMYFSLYITLIFILQLFLSIWRKKIFFLHVHYFFVYDLHIICMENNLESRLNKSIKYCSNKINLLETLRVDLWPILFEWSDKYLNNHEKKKKSPVFFSCGYWFHA